MEEVSAAEVMPEKVQAVDAGDAAATSRGDDEVLEGVTIGETLEEVYSSESDDGEEGIVIHAGRTTSRGRPQRKSFGGKNMTYTRPDALSPHSLMSPSASKGDSSSRNTNAEDELKKLRFLRHATAFDVDVNALEDHPWRNKTVDLLDYFNYGFNERTWLIYCEKQLRLRAQKGLGPYQPPPGAPSTAIIPPGAASQASASIVPMPAPPVAPVFAAQAFPPPMPTMPAAQKPFEVAVPPPAAHMQAAQASFAPPAPPVFASAPGPPVPPVNPGAGPGSFMPPPPAFPGRQMPPGPLGPPGAPSAPMPPAPSLHGAGPPMAPPRPGMPPPPVPAGFGPAPTAPFPPKMGQPPMNMNCVPGGAGNMQDMFNQQQNANFAGLGGVGPGLDMYGREIGRGDGFGGPPNGPSGEDRYPQSNHNGYERDRERGPGRDFFDRERRDPRDQRGGGGEYRDYRGNQDATGGKRKYPSSEELEGSSKRRAASNSRDRDRDRDRDRSERSGASVRPPPPPPSSARAPPPVPSQSDRRRDSRDREQDRDRSRGDSRDRRDRDRDAGKRSDRGDADRGGDRGDRRRSPENRRDARDSDRSYSRR